MGRGGGVRGEVWEGGGGEMVEVGQVRGRWGRGRWGKRKRGEGGVDRSRWLMWERRGGRGSWGERFEGCY